MIVRPRRSSRGSRPTKCRIPEPDDAARPMRRGAGRAVGGRWPDRRYDADHRRASRPSRASTRGWCGRSSRSSRPIRPRARSPKGAMGLMQLMPDDGAAVRGREPVRSRARTSRRASSTCKSLLDRFPLALALAAYNAGEAAVERFGGIPPYPETRDYVARILSSSASSSRQLRAAVDRAVPALHGLSFSGAARQTWYNPMPIMSTPDNPLRPIAAGSRLTGGVPLPAGVAARARSSKASTSPRARRACATSSRRRASTSSRSSRKGAIAGLSLRLPQRRGDRRRASSSSSTRSWRRCSRRACRSCSRSTC